VARAKVHWLARGEWKVLGGEHRWPSGRLNSKPVTVAAENLLTKWAPGGEPLTTLASKRGEWLSFAGKGDTVAIGKRRRSKR